jgi:hypothetical protein
VLIFLDEKRIPALALLLGLSSLVGCHKSGAQGADQATDASPESTAVEGAAAEGVFGEGGFVGAEAPGADQEMVAAAAPPPPVVAADPNIPLNEGLVDAAPTPPDYSAAVAPPSALVEDRPTQPEPEDVWIPGYWWWSPPLGRYVWVSGAWRRPPPDQVWSPGSWGLVDGRYLWTPGYWGRPGYARAYLDAPPPPLRAEAYVAPPGVGFVWMPGYYDYRGTSYVWVGGSWLRPPAVGLVWAEPRYLRIGGRFALQPGRWDFPPERRGIVYRPDIEVRPGGHLRLVPMPRELVVAHARFCTGAARAIARGATRMPNGGFVVGGNAIPSHERDRERPERDPKMDHGRERPPELGHGPEREHTDVDRRRFSEPHGGPPEEHRSPPRHEPPMPHANPGGDDHHGRPPPGGHGRPPR